MKTKQNGDFVNESVTNLKCDGRGDFSIAVEELFQFARVLRVSLEI